MSNTIEIIITELRDVPDEELVTCITNNVLPKIQHNFLMKTLMGTISERKVLNDFLRDFILQELQEFATWNRNKHKQMEDAISNEIILDPVIINKISPEEHGIANLLEEGVYDRKTIKTIVREGKVDIQYHSLEFEKTRLEDYVKEFFNKVKEKIELFFIFCDFVNYEMVHCKPLIPEVRKNHALAKKLSVVVAKPESFVSQEHEFFSKFGNPQEKFVVVKITFDKMIESMRKEEGEDKEGAQDEEIWNFYKTELMPFFKLAADDPEKEEIEGENEEKEQNEEEEVKVDPSQDPLKQLIEMGNKNALDFYLEGLFKQKKKESDDEDEGGENEAASTTILTKEKLEELIRCAGEQNEKYIIMRCFDVFPKSEILRERVLNIAMTEEDDDLFMKTCGDDRDGAIRLLFKTMCTMRKQIKILMDGHN